jgi:hypothetical protein
MISKNNSIVWIGWFKSKNVDKIDNIFPVIGRPDSAIFISRIVSPQKIM